MYKHLNLLASAGFLFTISDIYASEGELSKLTERPGQVIMTMQPKPSGGGYTATAKAYGEQPITVTGDTRGNTGMKAVTEIQAQKTKKK